MKFRLVLAGLLAIGTGDLAAAATKEVKAKHLRHTAKAKPAVKKGKPEQQPAPGEATGEAANTDARQATTSDTQAPAPAGSGRHDGERLTEPVQDTSAAPADGAQQAAADQPDEQAAPAPAVKAKQHRLDRHHRIANDGQDTSVATEASAADLDNADLKKVVHETDANLDAVIARYAARYEVPESLVRRVVRRESQFHPNLRHGPYWGLMQIRPDTARGMGYRGNPTGLLNASTNLNYAVPYLANAWRLSNGSEARAVQLYAGGYYYVAKRRGMLDQMIKSASAPSE
ncbi:lytic transglycosylase domain-containing protein [Methylovirgula sp. 4M-Z18]|uniref:lytic transglycosylase domain-containing protein n=1 Tax=Methylovirgula sp. 4M-Z18 TaxID=2293567 RepID=UPI000E2FE044|nr:lytic transglycosylase domain-containing protein [Methylovirgula sp. 4M-Z18]RFB78555.1 lytic transglycosylase domain-containing protein [Methylovirgula sp. 4M-Z18]